MLCVYEREVTEGYYRSSEGLMDSLKYEKIGVAVV